MKPWVRGRIRLRRLTKVDLAFLHFKAALAVMLWSPMWQNPTMQRELTGQMLTAWIIVTVAGFLFSVVGLVMGAQGPETRQSGFKVEMAGLWLLMAGPLVFLAVMVGLWWTTGEPRGLAVMFPYCIMAAIFARMVMVKSSMKTVLYRFPGEAKND